MFDPEAKRAQLERWVKWGVVAVGLAVTAPIAFYALEGMILWGALALTTLVFVNFAPVIGMWVANKRIAMMVAVIEANPIETMKNLFIEKSQDLAEKEANITDFDTELGNFRTEVGKVKKEFPEEVESYLEIQGKMEEVLKGMRFEQANAQAGLNEFSKHIHKAEMLFNLAKAANKMLEKSQSARDAYFQELKEQVSFNKVTRDLNRVFANLNTAVERRKNLTVIADAKQLPAAAEVIDITPGARVKSGVVH